MAAWNFRIIFWAVLLTVLDFNQINKGNFDYSCIAFKKVIKERY
jgi:hypothetical protein